MDFQARYRNWQRDSFFAGRAAIYIFARTMKVFAKPLYMYPCDPLDQDLSAAESVVDIGAGNGNFLAYRLQGQRKKHITLVDKNLNQLQAGSFNLKALRKNHAVETVIADAVHLPLASDTYDCVTSTGSINLWSDPVAGLGEMFRIAKPGASIWLWDQGPVESWREFVDAVFVKRMFGVGIPGYTMAEIERFAEQACRTADVRQTYSHVENSFYCFAWRKA